MGRYPFLSVVVPTRNRTKEITHCLESLLKIDYPNFEIIVVDNHSSDHTVQVLNEFPVQVIEETQTNQYAARNAGIRKAKGEIIAFTDSDCIVDPGWLKNLVQHYGESSIAGVGGKLMSFRPVNSIEKFLSLGTLDFQTPEGQWIQKKKDRFMSGLVGSANMSYRRDILERVGGFDESYRTCGDYDLCRRVQLLDYRLVHEPEAIVQHQHRSTLMQMIGQFFFYGFGQALLFKKQNQGLSYIRIKSYILDVFEKSFSFKTRPFFVTVDPVNFGFLFLVVSLIYPFFLKLGLLGVGIAGLGSIIRSFPVVKKMKSIKWLMLFPLFHFIRNTAFSIGRITGAVHHKVFFL